jgi:hypothetical protein
VPAATEGHRQKEKKMMTLAEAEKIAAKYQVTVAIVVAWLAPRTALAESRAGLIVVTAVVVVK